MPAFQNGLISMIVMRRRLHFAPGKLTVHLNMIEPNNGQSLSPKDNRLLAPKGSQARYTGELLLQDAPPNLPRYRERTRRAKR